MRPPAAASSAARSPAPLRRREKSPVKSGEYPASSSRARASGESGSAYPYEHPASRARPSWRAEREEEEEEEDDDGFQEEEEVDAFGLEPERQSRQLDRSSIEPEGIDPDDDPGDDIDLDNFSAYAYANTRRSRGWRDPSTPPPFRDIGPASGREACSRLAEGKGKGKYEGMAQVVPLASISESTSMSRSIMTAMPRSRPTRIAYPRRSDSPPPIPAPMGDVIEADSPWSDTYEAFYLTPLPPLSTTTYEVGDLDLGDVVRGRRTGRGHYVKKGIVIPPHTTAILISESAGSPTTTTAAGPTVATNTSTGTTTTSTSTSTSSSTTTTTATHTTTNIPPTPLTPTAITPDDDFDEDEGFSEPTTLEATATMERERERDLIACMRGGRATAMRGLAMGMGDGVGGLGDGGRAGGVGVVRPRVRKRISKRKGGRRDGGGV